MDTEEYKRGVAQAQTMANDAVAVMKESVKSLGKNPYATEEDKGRSRATKDRLRQQRRQNFNKKMHLIDPNYGKKTIGIVTAGVVLGASTTFLGGGAGAVVAPIVCGAIIGAGMTALEVNAHMSVGDFSTLDGLLADTSDDWKRTKTNHPEMNLAPEFLERSDDKWVADWLDEDDFGEFQCGTPNSSEPKLLVEDSEDSADDLLKLLSVTGKDPSGRISRIEDLPGSFERVEGKEIQGGALNIKFAAKSSSGALNTDMGLTTVSSSTTSNTSSPTAQKAQEKKVDSLIDFLSSPSIPTSAPEVSKPSPMIGNITLDDLLNLSAPTIAPSVVSNSGVPTNALSNLFTQNDPFAALATRHDQSAEKYDALRSELSNLSVSVPSTDVEEKCAANPLAG